MRLPREKYTLLCLRLQGPRCALLTGKRITHALPGQSRLLAVLNKADVFDSMNNESMTQDFDPLGNIQVN